MTATFTVHTYHPSGDWQTSRVPAGTAVEAERQATADRARRSGVRQSELTAIVT